MSKPPVILRPPVTEGLKSEPPEPIPVPSKVDPSFHRRFLIALGAIDSNPRVTTQLRGLISPFYKLSNPRLTMEHAPRALRRHPRKPERSTYSNREDLFLFHVGSAVERLQQMYKADAEYAKIPVTDTEPKLIAKAKVEGKIREYRDAIALIETLAGTDPGRWVVQGDDAVGYRLRVVAEDRYD